MDKYEKVAWLWIIAGFIGMFSLAFHGETLEGVDEDGRYYTKKTKSWISIKNDLPKDVEHFFCKSCQLHSSG